MHYNYEIHDNNGKIISGDFCTMLQAWNYINLADNFFEKLYGYSKSSIARKLKINKWKGKLKLVIVMQTLPERKKCIKKSGLQ